MASHFRTEDQAGGSRPSGSQRASSSGRASGSHSAQHAASGSSAVPSSRAGAPRPTTGSPTQTQRISQPRHGGDESYHAPESNPHASHISTTSNQGFVSVMSEPEDGRRRRKRNRRRKDKAFRQTDPYDIYGKRDSNPKRRRMRILSNLLFAVGLILVLVAVGMFAYAQWQYAQQDEVNEELASYTTISDDGATVESIDWDALKAINSDLVGWIQVPGTVINYPVYQGATNDTYLRTNAWGEYSIGGQIFMDYENTAPGLVDGQTIIYGHHLNDGSMFAALSDLEEDQDLFDSIESVWYFTEDATYELQPLFAYHAEADDTTVRTFAFSSTEELQSYLTDRLAVATTSAANAEELIASTDRVLTLCTCSYTQEVKGRMVLVCTVKNVTYNDDADATSAETTDAEAAEDAAAAAAEEAIAE